MLAGAIINPRVLNPADPDGTVAPAAADDPASHRRGDTTSRHGAGPGGSCAPCLCPCPARPADAEAERPVGDAVARLNRQRVRPIHRGAGCPVTASMINYTDALTSLIADIVARVEPLGFIEVPKLVVFARFGRTGAEGAYATCHSLNLPNSEPGHFFWKTAATGRVTRRSEWFVTKTPEVWMRQQRVDYLLSFSMPRFCDQSLEGARKGVHYPGFEPWIAKLDTVIHELYHIAPDDTGLRKFERADGGAFWRAHSPSFLEDVASFARAYLDTRPDPARYEFLRDDFDGLSRRYGTVAGTTFRNFPSYPQRYLEALTPQPEAPEASTIVPVERSAQPTRYTDHDLQVRLFSPRGARRITPPAELHTAA